jgi:molecular chaperone GrpE
MTPNDPAEENSEIQPERPGEKPAKQGAGQDDRVAELEAQLADIKNEALRYLAEAENTRKRAAKDKEDTAKYAITSFARELLDVADNLNRALAAVPQGEAGAAVKNLVIGVEATARQLDKVMEKAGIKKIEAEGQKFDPHLHRVVSEVDAAGAAPGTIVQVLQPGYMIHDRLLREAMVSVAKGGAVHVDQKV